MKQIYKLFALFLLAVVGVATLAAQITPGYYRIQSNHDNRFVVLDGSSLLMSSGTTFTSHNLSEIWKVESYGTGIRVISAQSALPVQKQTVSDQALTVGANTCTFYTRTDGTSYNISFNADFSGQSFWHNNKLNPGKVVSWYRETPNTPNQWKFVPVSDDEVATAAANFNLYSSKVTRLKSYDNKFMAVNESGKLYLSDTRDVNQSDVWVIENVGETRIFRNLKTGFSFSNDGNATTAVSTRMTEENYHFFRSSNSRFLIGRSTTITEAQFLTASADGKVVINTAQTGNSINPAAEWSLELVSGLTFDEAKAQIRSIFNYVSNVEDGQYYRLICRPYDRQATGFVINNNVIGQAENTTNLSQVWRINAMNDGRYSIQNPATEKYINNSAGTSAFFWMDSQASGFRFNFVDHVVPFLSIRGTNQGFHCAESQGYHVVGWSEDSEASKWYLLPATVDPQAIAEAKAKLDQKKNIDANRDQYTNRLQNFFADNACTQLLPSYQNIGEAQLRSLMSDLPQEIIEMAVRVQKKRWHTDDLANLYEQEFRIADYKAYSDPKKWAQNPYIPVIGSFSRLTSPTGISAREGQTVLVYVNDDIPTGATLKAELVYGFDVTGTQVELKKGVNALYFERDQHIYISYNINDPESKLADFNPIKIHIEGGYANGCFNLDRHDNSDWEALKSLKTFGFLRDEVFRMKSKRQIFSFHLDGIELQESKGNLNDHDNNYVGLEGILGVWDEITNRELELLNVEKFADRFNCVLFAGSNATSVTHASTYGTWYLGRVGDIFNYKQLTRGWENDEAANLWAVAHEVGHHFQQLINMSACTESSNNLFSQINVWKTGSNVSRGIPFKELAATFNQGKSWIDYGIGERMRFYWQLWLYFEEMGNHPHFYRELIDKLRITPLINGNADTDFLHFARLCADVAQEDLTDFFAFHGFFNMAPGTYQMTWGDTFYDTNYGKPGMTVGENDVAYTKEYMKRYQRKNANNMLFIDDRILPSLATYKNAPEGTMRLGTSPSATPGDAAEVGETGMFTDFKAGAATVASPQRVAVVGQLVQVQGTGAVGYKVYDAQGNFVFVANTHRFTVPEAYPNFKVTVAGGNGKEVVVVQNGRVLSQFDLPLLEEEFSNTANLLISENEAQPEHLYVIQNVGNQHYATATTGNSASPDDAARYAFFPGSGAGKYRIAVMDAAKNMKWLVCNEATQDKARVSLSDVKLEATSWNIVNEGNGTTFDIYTINTNFSWNWFGGITPAQTAMGLYSTTDPNSSWRFISSATPNFINTAGIAVSTNAAQPEYRYQIQNANNQNFVTATTGNSSSQTEAAPFAFFPADGAGLYRIAVWDANQNVKWLVCSNTAQGKDRIRLSNNDFEASAWNITREANGESVDIYINNNSSLSWNWHGGIGTAQTAMGLYSTTDPNSSWRLTTSLKGQLQEKMHIAAPLAAIENPGYPALGSAARANLDQAMTTAQNRLQGTVEIQQSDVEALANAITAYRSTTTNLIPVEDGKVYRIRHFFDGRYITNAPVGENMISATLNDDNTTLWVAQKVGDKIRFASLKGDGYLSQNITGRVATLATDAMDFTVGKGSQFGAFYLNAAGASLSGAGDKAYIENVFHLQYGNGSNNWGTDFFLDLVKDATYTLNVTACDNGNVATLVLPFAVTLPEGVKVYNAATPENGTLKIHDQGLQVLPANTPALLVATTAGEKTLTPAPQTTALNLGWKGALQTILNSSLNQEANTYYVLRKVDGYATLVQVSTANLPANRAYLEVPKVGGQAQKLTFIFGDDIVTGIETMAPAFDETAPVYDLSGRHVQRPSRGQIYLQNGRKVIF